MYQKIRNFFKSEILKHNLLSVREVISYKPVLYPTALQIVTAFSPFLLFIFIFKQYSSSEIIAIELLLVFNALSAVIICWSSTLFLSRIYLRLAKSGAISTIFFNRFIVSGLILTIYSILYQFTNVMPDNQEFLPALLLMLIAQIFDPSWFYMGQKKLYIPQFQMISQYFLALILCYFEFSPLLAIGFSWLGLTICFFLPTLKLVRFGLIRLSLSQRIFRRFLYPTLSETTTSLFSKLDVFYASIFMTSVNALTYILLRKHFIAIQSIIFASIRLLYLERNPDELTKINFLMKIYIAFTSTLGMIAVYYSIIILFEHDLPMQGIFALIIFAIGIPLGYYKVQTQLQFLYINGLFIFDLSITLFVLIIYILSLNLYSYIFADLLIWFVLARIINDVVYILIARTKQLFQKA